MRTRARSVSSSRPAAVVPRALALAVALSFTACSGAGRAPEPALDEAAAPAVEPSGPAARLEPLRAGAPDDPTEAFLRHCESTLLVRAGAAGDPGNGDLRSAWFGELVVPARGPSGHAIAALGDLLLETFREVDPDGARAVEASLGGPRSAPFEWAVPRLALLRERIGRPGFREVLRELVDRGRGGAPQSAATLAAIVAETDEAAAAWAGAWLASPARPQVAVQWRHDESRARLLVRVDQLHAVGEGRPEAYPFTLSVRIVRGDGSLEDASVDVVARRDVLEVPCEGEPLSVSFDPDGALDGLVDLVSEGDDAP